MLIVFDVGNTNTVLGCFKGEDLLFELRLKTDKARTVDEYIAALVTLLERKLGQDFKVAGCVVSSVVPPVTADILKVSRAMFGVEPLVVGPGIKSGIVVKVQEPASVGADRIANAVAAKELYGAPALVIDFGTATSFDVVSSSGCYEGGVIAPGPRTALESLVRNTSKLPHIELTWPKTVIGKNTVACMQSGIVVGYVSLVDGLIDRILAEMGEVKQVIGTGGLGRLFVEHSSRISMYDPYLTLKGLRILARLNDLV